MSTGRNELPPRLFDSPWFWLQLFSCAGLIALVVAQARYGQRQSQIERQYQGRAFVHRQAGPDPGGDAPPATRFSREDDTLIKLWPLEAVAVVLIVVSTAALAITRRPPRSKAARPEGPP